ncbi:signal peptidase I [Helcococcus sueciensis]|uniref:signal peptidase I n=1 Tax=Helcococcus sueciensis TaxID=241555 RepID=UPI0004164928|nr:signal peptidase I [Helcococcus sueciensis]
MKTKRKEKLTLKSKEAILDQLDQNLNKGNENINENRSDNQGYNQEKTNKNLYFYYLKKTIYILLIIFSFATILSHYFFPVVYTYGNDMSPEIKANSLLIGNKLSKIKQDDIVAYYYGNETIVSRVLALPGQLVERDSKGNIKVDGEFKSKDLGINNKDKNKTNYFSIRVPEESIFVLKDNSKILLNDKNKDLFVIKNKQVISKMFMILWPTNYIKIL